MAVIDAASTPGNSVCADHRAGGRQAVEHLVGLGHRALVLLGDSRRSLVQTERIEGMQSALPGDALARVLWLEDGTPDFAALAREGMTAVVATSDLHALTAITQLQGAGLAVPRDVSVIGFDDLGFSACITPSLTTMAQDMPAIAATAVQHLILQLGGDPVPDASLVPMKLLVRDSTGPAQKPGRPHPNKET